MQENKKRDNKKNHSKSETERTKFSGKNSAYVFQICFSQKFLVTNLH